jgi:NAD(P)-dependent dehydrogenase (short-subunit alcohol dehydrogenase family)
VQELGGKVCVVTGGASGIGLAMARRFQAAGMRLALADIEAGPLDAAVAELGGDTLGVRCDVTSAEDNQRLRDEVLERFGAAHVVCLNAGVAPSGAILESSVESWRWVLDVNVIGIVHGVHAFGPGLVAQGEGHVVCTASAAGLVTAPFLGAYSASKHAVVGLAAVLREELAPSGVGVSVACPGFVKSRIFESERNRPASLADEREAAPEAQAIYQQILDAAPGPELVADAVHDAVLADRLFVLPSPELSDAIRSRLAEVEGSLPS